MVPLRRADDDIAMILISAFFVSLISLPAFHDDTLQLIIDVFQRYAASHVAAAT